MLTHTHRRATLALALLAACLLPVITQAQSTVRIVVDRDFVNIRIVPALGADLVGTANAGTPFTATGRSPDNEWLQIDFAGGEAWVSSVVVTVLEGDIGALPIRDPRTIPYGGTDAPRAGFTDATSDIIGRLPLNGVRVRSGPSVAYVVLADAPRFTEFPLLGRTPNNQWIQVNFDGTLGWVASQFVEIQDNRNIEELPIDGVVANQQPLDFDSENEFFGVLRRMRDRLDIAQASLEQIQAIWTDAALGIVPFCGNYPSQPTSFNLPRAIYAEYFALIDPILNDLNAAFAAHEQSIELLIEACNRPGSQAALISIPVTTGGLELANSADNAYVGLRRRIDELLPELGPDDCVFSFGGRVDVLPYLGPLVSDAVYVFTDNFDLTRRTNGYCFDATTSNIGYFELGREDTDYDLIVAISPLDDPTDFIATASIGASGFEGANIQIFPVNFPRDGRYILITSALLEPDAQPTDEYILLAGDFSFGTPQGTFLALDENGELVIREIQYTTPDGGVGGTVSVEGGVTVDDTTTTTTATNTSGTVTNNTGSPVNMYEGASTDSAVVSTLGIGETASVISAITDWYFIQRSDNSTGWVQASEVTFTADSTTTSSSTSDTTASTTSSSSNGNVTTLCPGVTLTCDQLFTCAEVQACVNAGSTVLDPNGNGVACDAADGINPLSCTVPYTP